MPRDLFFAIHGPTGCAGPSVASGFAKDEEDSKEGECEEAGFTADDTEIGEHLEEEDEAKSTSGDTEIVGESLDENEL